MLKASFQQRAVFTTLLLLFFGQNGLSQESRQFYFGKEIGVDFAPFLFDAQGGSILLKSVLGHPKFNNHKWAKQNSFRCLPGFYRINPSARMYNYQRGDSILTKTKYSNQNVIIFLIGIERQLAKKRFSFSFGCDLVSLNERSRTKEVTEISEPGVTHKPIIRNQKSGLTGFGISTFAGCRTVIHSRISLGVEAHISFVISSFSHFDDIGGNSNSDKRIETILWPQILYISYRFDKRPFLPVQK